MESTSPAAELDTVAEPDTVAEVVEPDTEPLEISQVEAPKVTCHLLLGGIPSMKIYENGSCEIRDQLTSSYGKYPILYTNWLMQCSDVIPHLDCQIC